MNKPEMKAKDVLHVLHLLEEHGVEVFVDGGWAVDAVLGRVTRCHEDLDIALPHRFVPQLRQLLEAEGYQEVLRDDTWECNFVLQDAQGHMVDVHSYTLDKAGNNIFGVAYQAHHLTGQGTILGRKVRCPSPEVLVEFHTGYQVDENDYQDVNALCQTFNLPLPKEYDQFLN